jgi:hypothetical protein
MIKRKRNQEIKYLNSKYVVVQHRLIRLIIHIKVILVGVCYTRIERIRIHLDFKIINAKNNN